MVRWSSKSYQWFSRAYYLIEVLFISNNCANIEMRVDLFIVHILFTAIILQCGNRVRVHVCLIENVFVTLKRMKIIGNCWIRWSKIAIYTWLNIKSKWKMLSRIAVLFHGGSQLMLSPGTSRIQLLRRGGDLLMTYFLPI